MYDALRLKNTIQVIGLCVCNIGLLIYAAVQMDQIHEAVERFFNPNSPSELEIDKNVWIATKPFLVAIPCVIAVGTVLMSIVAWKLYDEFAWTIYKHISADLRMKRRYLTYQVRPQSRLFLGSLLTISSLRSILHYSSSIFSSSLASPFNSSSLWLTSMIPSLA